MILQALTQYYESMLKKGKISRPGWSDADVTFAIVLNDDGSVDQIVSLETERLVGKKMVLRPRSMKVPMQVKRSAGIAPNFLCDNAVYLLAVDVKNDPKRTLECFYAAKELHLQILQDVCTPAADAVKAFWNTWNPEQTTELPQVQEVLEQLKKGGRLIFWYENEPVTQDSLIASAWQQHYDGSGEEKQMQCLVTGKPASIPAIHPAIKGVRGAQATGAALVSYNSPAFESYEKTQNYNGPVGEYAVFAYTTALNSLLADRNHVQVIGDTTVVCWAEGGEEAYQDLAMYGLMGVSPADEETTQNVRAALKSLAEGRPILWNQTSVIPSVRFYVLGLAPNAARISVRFFLQNNFGSFLKNVEAHYERMNIVRPAYDKNEQLSLWMTLQETVNPKSNDKSPSPQLSGDMLRAILENSRYPATLLNSVMLRIRAEHDITRGKAGIIKAYYLRNENLFCPEEVLQMSLNEQSKNIPYTLGRLFSVLEDIQQAANPEINATIKDKYFNSAAATPANVFPLLLNLAQKHLRKLETGKRIYLESQIAPLTGIVGEQFPVRLNLPEQGSFQLGYYFQTQKRYQKKEDKDNG